MGEGKPQLHFTFSPVQEFVEEARKTADLRSGSYILSYLAARAVVAAIKAGGKREEFFPNVEQNALVEAVQKSFQDSASGKPHSVSVDDTLSQYGSLPNRFAVPVRDDGREIGKAASEALQAAWADIARSAQDWIIERHEPFADGYIKRVWDAQIRNQWFVNWVISEDDSTLNSRKALRTFTPLREDQEKCTACGYRQALAPEVPPPDNPRSTTNTFWQQVRERQNLGAGTIRNKERLCGVCLTKRLFPKVSKDTIGWAVSSEFQSTPDFAALPWQKQLAKDPDAQPAIEKFMTIANRYRPRPTETFVEISGATFYPSYYDDLLDDCGIMDEANREISKKELTGACANLFGSVGSRPGNTYAVLAMDGDQMGTRLSRLRNHPGLQKEMSELILEFSGKVRKNVESGDNGAKLIYSGGEDVLAILPMDVAFEVACRLHGLYSETFEGFYNANHVLLEDQQFTISGGLLFCPMTLPLRTAIHQAHDLEERAKEGAGRNALAVAVWRGGGEILSIAHRWNKNGGRVGWVEKLRDLQSDYASTHKPKYPSRFLYQSAQLVRELGADSEGSGGFNEEAVKRLLAREFMGSREEEHKTHTVQQAKERIEELLTLAYEDGSPGNGRWNPDIFRLVRFVFEEDRV